MKGGLEPTLVILLRRSAPPNLEEMIPEGRLDRVVDEIIERLDIETLKRQYKGGGTSAYHPRMPCKVLV
ncbi:MAG: hypothetical protein R6U57_13160 [Anaerolineales bacterium]